MIGVEDARHVLWYHGDKANGWQPGMFTSKLLSAAGHADAYNLEALAEGFPGLIAAVRVAQYEAGGMERLVAIAEGRHV